MATATKKKTTVKEDEPPRAFAEDMLQTVKRHWKFFLGFILGSGVAYYLFT